MEVSGSTSTARTCASVTARSFSAAAWASRRARCSSLRSSSLTRVVRGAAAAAGSGAALKGLSPCASCIVGGANGGAGGAAGAGGGLLGEGGAVGALLVAAVARRTIGSTTRGWKVRGGPGRRSLYTWPSATGTHRRVHCGLALVRTQARERCRYRRMSHSRASTHGRASAFASCLRSLLRGFLKRLAEDFTNRRRPRSPCRCGRAAE